MAANPRPSRGPFFFPSLSAHLLFFFFFSFELAPLSTFFFRPQVFVMRMLPPGARAKCARGHMVSSGDARVYADWKKKRKRLHQYVGRCTLFFFFSPSFLLSFPQLSGSFFARVCDCRPVSFLASAGRFRTRSCAPRDRRIVSSRRPTPEADRGKSAIGPVLDFQPEGRVKRARGRCEKGKKGKRGKKEKGRDLKEEKKKEERIARNARKKIA